MAFTFKPVLYSPSTATTLYLPQPLDQCQLSFQWKSKSHSVPKGEGRSTYGLVADSITIAFSGAVSKQDTTDTVSEEDMWTAFEDIQTVANEADDQRLEAFIFYDSVGATYRKFKECWIQSLVPQVGDSNLNLFGYSLTVVADDPTIYTTGPGS